MPHERFQAQLYDKISDVVCTVIPNDDDDDGVIMFINIIINLNLNLF